MKKTLSYPNHRNCSDLAHFFIPNVETPTDMSGEMRGIIDIPKNDSTFYKDKRISITHGFNDPLVGELYYELNLPIDQRIFPKKVDGQVAEWKTDEVIFDEVPHQAKLVWSVQTKVKTLKTTRVEVNGNVLCKED